MPVCRTCKKQLSRFKSFFQIPAERGKPERNFCTAKCAAKHLTERFMDELGIAA